MAKQSRKSINFRMLRRIIGSLLFLEAVFLLVPVATAFIYNEIFDLWVFSIVACAAAFCGYIMWLPRPRTTRMGKREGFLLTSSVWVIYSIFGMLPFIFGSPHADVSTSFFEAMSGFTTTGATAMATFPTGHAVQIWQAMMQWLGGMGIILFTVAILPAFNTAAGMHMFNAEATGITHDKVLPRISQTAMALWGVYLSLTIILIGLLWIGPMDLFESICHAFGTISTGGYSCHPDSISGYESDYVMIIICVFMILGGMNFTIIFKSVWGLFARGRFSRISNNQVLKVYFLLIGIYTLLFIIGHIIHGEITSWRDVTIIPLFQVVSIVTSTGYIAPGFSLWVPFILALTFIMMFCGGCAGSTSGGAKIDRILYLKDYVINEVRRSYFTNAIFSVRLNGRVISADLVGKVVAFLCLMMMLIVAGGLAMSLFNLAPVDSFFSAFSCICNTGFGASLTGYGQDFAMLPDSAKWILSALMLTGRLEIFSILVLFSPGFWK